MCIAIPARVIETDGQTARVERYGEELTVDLTLMPEPVAVGDYVVIQARRFAVTKVDAAAAEESYRLFDEIIATMDGGGKRQ